MTWCIVWREQLSVVWTCLGQQTEDRRTSVILGMFATKSFLCDTTGKLWKYSALTCSPGQKCFTSEVLLLPARVRLELVFSVRLHVRSCYPVCIHEGFCKRSWVRNRMYPFRSVCMASQAICIQWIPWWLLLNDEYWAFAVSGLVMLHCIIQSYPLFHRKQRGFM